MKALVIDDEADILMMAQMALEMEGWEVATASTPSEGLALASSGGFDVVLLDLTFPDADGWEVLSSLQAVCSTPVLLVSGKISAATLHQHGDIQVAGVIEKPFDVMTLAREVASRLQG